jgi:hypothetical protein
LKDCSTWTKEICAIDGDESEYQANLLRSLKRAEEKGSFPTFMKTVEVTARHCGGDMYRYEQVLGNLITDGFIRSDVCTAFSDRGEFKTLVVDWERVKTDLEIAVV